MLKRTLHFSNPTHLSVRNAQLVIELKTEERIKHSVPIEDIGVIILAHPQISITSSVFGMLLDHKVALVASDSNYMPAGMFLPFDAHTEQTARMLRQVEASIPLKKQLWQQTIRSKIANQAKLLEYLGCTNTFLLNLESKVRSGDSTNCEGQAAAYYWKAIFGAGFTRSRNKVSPNAHLNYGYAILRSMVARAIASSGLHPSLGIFHRNKYNAFCLADDIMEPYRPFVDQLVLEMLSSKELGVELTKADKIALLTLPQLDVRIGRVTRPLFHAISHTTSGLASCFEGKTRKIPYPILSINSENNENQPF